MVTAATGRPWTIFSAARACVIRTRSRLPIRRIARIDGSAPRRLTFTQADRAISAFAAKLHSLELHTDAVVGLQLPNTVESVIALLGVLRAGMIAAPLPILWRKRDITDALQRAGATAIVTAARIGETDHAEIAMQAAAELFSVRFVCAFRRQAADGIIPLDDILEATPIDLAPPLHREHLGAHVAVLTFETRTDGLRGIARSHAQLVGSGRRMVRECGLPDDGNLLSTIPLTSFAGLSTALLPWLIGGGTLHLHHGFCAESFAAQCDLLDGGTVVVSGPALPALAETLKSAGTVIALWRSPERMCAAPALTNGIVDIACFGETGCIATRRDAKGAIRPLAGNADMRRTKAGTLALRASGLMCDFFPPQAKDQFEDAADTIDTGFPCQFDAERGTLAITGAPPGLALVGA